MWKVTIVNNGIMLCFGRFTQGSGTYTLPTSYTDYFIVLVWLETHSTDNGTAETGFGCGKQISINSFEYYNKRTLGPKIKYISIGY